MLYHNMKAPGDKRPTVFLNGVLQIHITRVCNLSCTACTQGSNLGGKPIIMNLENFEKAVMSLKDYFGVVGVFGGNPTMHPQFPEICAIMRKHIDFKHRGLWSNNLMGHGAICRETFNPAVSNLNVHCDTAAYEEMKRDWPECNPIGLQDSRHSPPFVALKDIKDLTDDQRWDMINHCDVNQYWSAMICQFRGELRAFFCELAGAQSMLHEHEADYPDTGLKVVPGWWKLPIQTFENQIKKHCFDCGIPLKGRGDLAVGGAREFVSATHLGVYKLKQRGKELVLVDSLAQLGGNVARATDYINNGLSARPTMYFPEY